MANNNKASVFLNDYDHGHKPRKVEYETLGDLASGENLTTDKKEVTIMINGAPENDLGKALRDNDTVTFSRVHHKSGK
tara:strand:+ start:227 stop:460 length:234 start_codon:yes stop_codon:yes gene_type:complete